MRKDTNSMMAKRKPRCEVCGGCFGLIRHRFAQKQFCSKRCLEQYLAKSKQRPSHPRTVDRFFARLGLALAI
jgi:hypothetical protein